MVGYAVGARGIVIDQAEVVATVGKYFRDTAEGVETLFWVECCQKRNPGLFDMGYRLLRYLWKRSGSAVVTVGRDRFGGFGIDKCGG